MVAERWQPAKVCSSESNVLPRAKVEGVSVDVLLRRAVLQIIAAEPEVSSQPLTADEWEREFDEWLDNLTLSDEAIIRGNIYA